MLSTVWHASLWELGPTNELPRKGINRCVLSTAHFTLKLTGPPLILLTPRNDRQHSTSTRPRTVKAGRLGHSNAGAKSSKQSLPQEQSESLWNPRWQQTTLVQAGLRDAAWQASGGGTVSETGALSPRSCRQARSVTLELSVVGTQCERASEVCAGPPTGF